MQNNTDFDLALPAQELGFSLDVGPIIGDLRRLSPEESEKALADQIRQKALVNVDVLSELLTEKALDPVASSKLIGDALEANYKLSGLAAKNAVKDAPTAVSINIIGLASKTTAVSTEHLTIENTLEINDVVIEAAPDGP